VIDWEHVGLRPIIFDLAPLMAAFPGIEQAIATHMAGIKAPPVALPFREQCLLSVAAQIVAWPRHEGKHQTSNWQAKRLQSRLSQLFNAVRHAPGA
jgi:thiamine kinase-like enzyme